MRTTATSRPPADPVEEPTAASATAAAEVDAAPALPAPPTPEPPAPAARPGQAGEVGADTAAATSTPTTPDGDAAPWPRVRRIATAVVLLALIVVLGIAATALARGTWAVNPVLTGSMRPGIPVGGVVISEQVPVSQLQLRDVIVFRSPLDPTEQVVHRIVAITVERDGQRVFRTQGDANPAADPWRLTFQGSDAYRVRWSLPLLGYVAVAYENHRGIALILAGAVLLLVAIPTIAKARRRSKPDPADA